MEYDEGEGHYAFLVHTGSRNLGKKVWEKWNKIASGDKIPHQVKKDIEKEVKAKNKDRTKMREEIDVAMKAYRESLHPGYLGGEDMRYYLTDMAVAQAYARWNHIIILQKAEEIYISLVKGSKMINSITTVHNYVDFDTVDGVPMIRKGAVRANSGEEFILPFNMRDGVAICKGKGNPDWNYSCSHGAGRVMSRAKAKETLKLKDFEKSMEGIYSTTVNTSTIDEAPMAYKPKGEIIENIEPTCDILFFMKPLINIKAGKEDEIPSWRELKKRK